MTSPDTPPTPKLDGSLAPAPVTEQMLQHARANAGGQVYVIDPEFDPDGEVPGWAIRGYYPVDSNGTLDTSSWVANPDYRPGPLTRGWARPRNRVERALQLAAAGYQPDALLLAALAQAEVTVLTTGQSGDQIPVLAGEGGQDTVAVFTSSEHVSTATPHRSVAVADLLPLLPTVIVAVNPGRVPSARLNGAALAEAVRATPPPHHDLKP